ncbi:MAG: hypothetical protein JWN10_2801 [Solirubrobacterales bacterium]|nr:hypothetical protein [Solirubrobacterales bacterium]
MRRRIPRVGVPRLAVLASAIAAAVIVFGALVWFLPYLTKKQTSVSSVPAPSALTATSPYQLAPGQQACMTSVAVEPNSLAAQFELHPAKPGPQGGPPVALVLSAPGYRSVSQLAGGYPGGLATVATTPPRHSLLASACFVDRGDTDVVLLGSAEARTVSRSGTSIAGVSVVGDVALTFLDTRPSSLVEQAGTIFSHASNLTDHLIPVWLIWILAVLVAFGVPLGILGAFYTALREDEAAAAS